MSPPVQPVASDPRPPNKTDVVVVGGGIIGVSAAYSLAKKGVSVALCEKGVIAGEQSSRNWGWCRVMNRDPAEIPLCLESLRMWGKINREVGAETGFRRAGIAYVCETPHQLAMHEAWLQRAREYQVNMRLLDAKMADSIFPELTRRWLGALISPDDGRAEPQLAVPAMAEAARRLGTCIVTTCAVRGVETSGGSISGVVTERGRIACNTVLVAGGAWSRLFCGAHGIEFPQLKVLASVLRTAPMPGLTECAVGAPDFAFHKRLDGGYTIAPRGEYLVPIVPETFKLFFKFLPAFIRDRQELRLRIGRPFLDELRTPRRWALDEPSPFEKVRVLDPEPSHSSLEKVEAKVVQAYPGFRGMKIVERWAGLVDATPDALPVISPIRSTPGFFLASGFSGHGFGIGPAAGRLAADLITGDYPIVDPTPFRFERLVQGGRSISGTIVS